MRRQFYCHNLCLPVEETMGVYTWDGEHEYRGGNQDHVKCCQSNQQTVNRALHLGPEKKVFITN